MANISTAQGYDVARAQGVCRQCNRELSGGEKLMAALRESAVGFERLDICLTCWPVAPRDAVVAHWQTTLRPPEARKKLLVDDEVLLEIFQRLTDVTEPAKLNFRFVLGLILMRKRLLVYESTRQVDGRELWTMRLKGSTDTLDLLNPRLDEAQVAEVSQQLGEVLNQQA